MSGSTPISAPDYGHSLVGMGFNLIVKDLNQSVHFATKIIGASMFFRTDRFAAMKLSGLRECACLDKDSFAWIPSHHLSKEK